MRVTLLLATTALMASAGLADEPEAKRSASLPGTPRPFTVLQGLSISAELPRQRVPATWLKQLATLQRPARTVLLPSPLPRRATLVVGPTWYSFKWQEGPRHLVLLVHYEGFHLAGLKGFEADPSEIVVGRSHGLVSASVHLQGAAVTLDIECAEGGKDPACGTDDGVRQRLADLAVLR